MGIIGGVTMTVPAEQPTTAPPEAIAWLKAHVNPIVSCTAESGFADLQALKRLIGDARIVALGEATHGTREFFTLKHRLLEFLVTEMDFTTLAMEVNWPNSDRVDAYVQGGEGDPAQLLAGLGYWTWNTEEVLAMVNWMRRHNERPGREPRVRFTGFDVQSAEMAIQHVLGYLDVVDAAARADAADRYDCFRAFVADYRRYGDQPEETKSACYETLQQVYDDLDMQREIYEERSSVTEYARALQCARVVLQSAHVHAAGPDGNWEVTVRRDRAMADNVDWLLEQAGPGEKLVLWAHNMHVNNRPGWMGSYLRARYGRQLLIVGLTFYQGAFRALASGRTPDPFEGVREYWTGPAPPDSYEAFFHAAGHPSLVVDLRAAAPETPAGRWLAGPRPFRRIGSVYQPSRAERYFSAAVPLPSEYDLIVYVDATSASVPVR
jgi:erythromycin esterase